MKAFVLNIDLTQFSASHIVSVHGDKYAAERAAQEYAKQFPDSTVGVYIWESGWTSFTSVVVERQFYAPEMPPTVIEPVHPAILDAFEEESK